MTKPKSEIPPIVLLLIIGIGIYLLYKIVVLLVKSFVYFGYNALFFTDNMLQIPSWNPIVAWSILGVFIGSIFGVGVAINKFHLSKKLILYPILIAVLFITTMCFINKPGQYALSPETVLSPAPETTTLPSTKYYYKATMDVTVRSGPSTTTSKLFTLSKGTTVEMVQRFFMDNRNLEWIKIRYNNREGYVSSKCLKFSRSSVS